MVNLENVEIWTLWALTLFVEFLVVCRWFHILNVVKSFSLDLFLSITCSDEYVEAILSPFFDVRVLTGSRQEDQENLWYEFRSFKNCRKWIHCKLEQCKHYILMPCEWRSSWSEQLLATRRHLIATITSGSCTLNNLFSLLFVFLYILNMLVSAWTQIKPAS